MKFKNFYQYLNFPSGSLAASDLFWPEIWGDLVKISRGEQRKEREHVIICIIIYECLILHAGFSQKLMGQFL